MLNLPANLVALVGLGILAAGIAMGEALIAGLVAAPLLVVAARVSARLPSRRLLVARLLDRIAAQGYDARLFRGMCADLCLRVATAYIHWRVGRLADLRPVLRRFRHARTRLIVPGSATLAGLVERGDVSAESLRQAVVLALRQAPHRSGGVELDDLEPALALDGERRR